MDRLFFTNLEKLYIYRYVFAKGTESNEKIEFNMDKISNIPDNSIKKILIKMLEDRKDDSVYKKNNTLRQDKLLWIAREYQKQGIYYSEITDTTFTKKRITCNRIIRGNT